MKKLTRNFTKRDQRRSGRGPYRKQSSTVSAKSGSSASWSALSGEFDCKIRIRFAQVIWSMHETKWKCSNYNQLRLEGKHMRSFLWSIHTNTCWQCTDISPIKTVRIGPKMIPPFLKASPMPKIPAPTFPRNRCMRVSTYLKIWISNGI